jgi:hypothetical protein
MPTGGVVRRKCLFGLKGVRIRGHVTYVSHLLTAMSERRARSSTVVVRTVVAGTFAVAASSRFGASGSQTAPDLMRDSIQSAAGRTRAPDYRR